MYGPDVTLVLQVASVRELQGDIQYEVYEVNHAREARALVGLVANLRQALAMSGAAFSRGSASSRSIVPGSREVLRGDGRRSHKKRELEERRDLSF